MSIVKKFLEWIRLKEKLHENNAKIPLFKEGEVWWCAIGENVGIEMNGKSKKFSRPEDIKKIKNGFYNLYLGQKFVPPFGGVVGKSQI